VDVVGLDGSGGYTAVTVVAGEAHTCALLASGAVRCWGDDTHGQLGDAPARESHGKPVEVVGLDGSPGNEARALSAGLTHVRRAVEWRGALLGQRCSGAAR
jgi:hypothetical protein